MPFGKCTPGNFSYHMGCCSDVRRKRQCRLKGSLSGRKIRRSFLEQYGDEAGIHANPMGSGLNTLSSLFSIGMAGGNLTASIMPFAENRRSYPYQGGSFFDCNFEIAGHSHGEFIHADPWDILFRYEH